MRRRPLIQTLPVLLAAAGPPGRAVTPGEKVLHLAFPSPETTLDPPQSNSDANTWILLAQILEAPLTYDYLARPVALVPATAEALPEVSADGRTFTVRIKRGITFADDPAFKGGPRELTAQDYVYAIKRYFDPRYNSSDLYIFETLKIPGMAALREKALKNKALKNKTAFDYDTEVEGLRTLDRYTLRVQLGVPDPRFIYQLATPSVTGAVAREVVEFYGDEIGAHPVGTGAFRLKSWRRGSRIELERSPNFRATVYQGTPADEPWAQQIAAELAGQRLPRVDRVVVDIVEETQPRFLSFVNGSYHWLEVPADFRQLAAPEGKLAPYLAKRGVRLQMHPQPDMAMSFFFMEHPLVGGYTPEKVALRRAISLAFDEAAYVRHVQGGYGVPAQSTVPPYTTGYDSNYRSEMASYDPARARALLDLYGYVDSNGDGWRDQPDGQPLVLRMAGTATQLERRSHELWKRAMTAVGLKIEFEVATWPQLLNKSRAGSLMMWGYRWSANSPDGGFFLAIAYGPNASESNDARFSLPEFDRLFERQRSLPDGPEREAVIKQAKNLLVAYMPYKTHIHTVLPVLVQPWTRGFWRHPFMRDQWRFVDVQTPA